MIDRTVRNLLVIRTDCMVEFPENEKKQYGKCLKISNTLFHTFFA